MHYFLFFIFGLGIFQTNPVIAADTIKIFTYRQPALLAPILEAYSKAKGVEFQIVYAPKGLVARLQAEGESAQADLVITTDISRVKELADSGLLAPSRRRPVMPAAVPSARHHGGQRSGHRPFGTPAIVCGLPDGG